MKYAILNESGLLVDYSDEEVAGGIPVEDECDLVPLHYRWVEESGCFMPCDPPNKEEVSFSAEKALFDLIHHFNTSGYVLPGSCVSWARDFAKTQDAKDAD